METTSPSIALQLYTVRTELEASNRFEAALEGIAEIGYENVELAGLYGRSPEEFHRILSRCGLKASSAHEALEGMEKDLNAVVDRAEAYLASTRPSTQVTPMTTMPWISLTWMR